MNQWKCRNIISSQDNKDFYDLPGTIILLRCFLSCLVGTALNLAGRKVKERLSQTFISSNEDKNGSNYMYISNHRPSSSPTNRSHRIADFYTALSTDNLYNCSVDRSLTIHTDSSSSSFEQLSYYIADRAQ